MYQQGGSGAGVKSRIIEGTSDFGMLARGVKDEEKRKKIGDMKEFVLG